MDCNFVPDKLLKKLGDKNSLKISKKIKSDRNVVKRFFLKAIKVIKASGKKAYIRLSLWYKHSGNVSS